VGTVTTMPVALQLAAVAAVPLNVTVLVPWIAPKFVPAIVTDVPTDPAAGARLVIPGGAGGTVTVKFAPLLAWPPTVTTTFPVAAPAGTLTTIPVALQLIGVAGVPLNVTVLVPWLAPKFVPAIVTDVPTDPAAGARLVIPGGTVTVKFVLLLVWPPTMTTTLPVAAPTGTVTTMLVAFQFSAVAAVPLNVTLLAPWIAPRFVPAIVTDAPTDPAAGVRLVIPGGTVTVKFAPLLAWPPTMTTTLPVAAPV